MGQSIDLRTWKRRQHYELFRRYAQPFFSVCVGRRRDTTVAPQSHLWRPTVLSDLPLPSCCALPMRRRAFRLRLRKRGVWLHNHVSVGSAVLRLDHTFTFARLNRPAGLNSSSRGAPAIAESQARKRLEPYADPDDIVYHSSLPWLRFTSFTNAIGGTDSIHALCLENAPRKAGVCDAGSRRGAPRARDGLDVARFLERFQRGLLEFR